VVVLVSTFAIPPMAAELHRRFADYFAEVAATIAAGDVDALLGRVGDLAFSVGLVLTPFLVLAMFLTAAGLAVQGGVTLTAEGMRPKLERISVKAGFRRLFSAQSVVETVKAMARLVVLAILVTVVAGDLVTGHLAGSRSDLAAAGAELAANLLLLVRAAALIGLVIGLADYAYQRHKVGKQLRMSKREIKQEARTSEGDPMVRSRRRSLHAKLTRNQMLSAVNDASVVVVNPTHVAVALAYEPGAVPKVVAKGGDELAMRIRERAFDRGIPVVEARLLARILHDSLPVGAEVPADMYEAVAIVIAFVLRQPKTAVSRIVRSVHVPRSKLGGRDAA
jgi:flagellar biosynthetic protein FlhB